MDVRLTHFVEKLFTSILQVSRYLLFQTVDADVGEARGALDFLAFRIELVFFLTLDEGGLEG